MALQSVTEIYIGGTPVHAYQSFTLNQEIDTHHYLRLDCRTDVLEELGGELSNNTKNFLGKTLTLQVAALDTETGYEKLRFKGVVTAIENKKNNNNDNIVSIIVQSPTILCDDGSHYGSYLDKTLNEIIRESFSEYDSSKLATAIAAKNTTSPIHYSVQHRESNWQYASRLAKQYSEWLYYDGRKLIFGEHQQGEDVTLIYGKDLKGFSLDLVPLPNNFNYFTNDYLTDQQHQKKTSEISSGANGYTGFVSKQSKTLYAKETSVWINGFNDPGSKHRLDQQVVQQKKAVESRQVLLKGDSDNPGVGIGKTIVIQGDTSGYGRYRVTKVSHTNGENGLYQNAFEAVGVAPDVFPKTSFESFPKSDTQTAVVVKNSDPQGMARVKVQFPWQKPTHQTTPWIRVVTPHGGGDKGFHFIPEIGEEVLVGFEGGNAERPYMMGSLYHGKAGANGFKSDANDIKALQTRSGNKVVMNDKDGSITVADPSGNVIIMQGNGEVIIKAPNKLTLASTDINIVAGNSLNLIAKPGEEEDSSGEGIINVFAQKSMNTIVEDETLSFTAKQDVSLNSQEKNIDIAGKEMVKISSEKIESISENDTVMNADKMNIKTTGITEISGKEVNVNES